MDGPLYGVAGASSPGKCLKLKSSEMGFLAF